VAAERGIALDGLAAFRQGEASADPALVLGYANMTEQAITRGVAELARAIC
jgi:DNA-binding transcriptional MocR family regulator